MKFNNDSQKINNIFKNLTKSSRNMIIVGICLLAGAFFVAVYLFYESQNREVANESIAPPGVIREKESTPSATTIEPSPTLIAEVEESQSEYKLHKGIYATMFWVGEDATEANAYIPNKASAWDTDWMEHYGGIDNPYERNGYHPADFVPRENPFYFALPYGDFGDSGKKESVTQIPWYEGDYTGSLLKNRWIKITRNGRVCYGQWQDVGPFEGDDFNYVFGDAEPKNRVGIDLSPAMRDCLHMVTNGNVDWQFVNEENVPDGPWREIVTTSQLNW